MNNTSYNAWVAMQLEPDLKLTGGGPKRELRQPEQDYSDYYERNRKYIEASLWEQEEAEDNYLRSHGVPMKDH